jgi:hypothetical protein
MFNSNNSGSSKQVVLATLDDQIASLERKLEPYRAIVDELDELKRARAALLGQPHARRGRPSTLDADVLADAMRAANRPLTPPELANALGADAAVVRSHLNRHLGTRYAHEGHGWVLIAQSL